MKYVSLVPWSVDEDTIDPILCEIDRIMQSIIDHERDTIGLTEGGFRVMVFREMIREVDPTRMDLRKVLPDPELGISTMIMLIARGDDMEDLLLFHESVDAIDRPCERSDTGEVVRLPERHELIGVHIALRKVSPVK